MPKKNCSKSELSYLVSLGIKLLFCLLSYGASSLFSTTKRNKPTRICNPSMRFSCNESCIPRMNSSSSRLCQSPLRLSTGLQMTQLIELGLDSQMYALRYLVLFIKVHFANVVHYFFLKKSLNVCYHAFAFNLTLNQLALH